MVDENIHHSENDMLDIEATFPLSPIQEGMLMHTLREPRAGLFFQQSVTPSPNLDVEAYVQAWQVVINRHDIFRTSFHWEHDDEPYQAVHRHVEVPVERLDLSDLDKSEQMQQMRKILRRDRQEGFDLRQAPLVRLIIIYAGNNQYYVVKSHHHIILDGWSGGIALKEVMADYRATLQGQTASFPAAGSFFDYINWIQRKDLTDAESFWKKTLAGIEAPTPLPRVQSNQPPSKVAGDRFYSLLETIPSEISSELQKKARRWRVTLSTLIHGVWGTLLSIYSNEKHILFGSTFSGRPSEIDNVENIVGVFINVLPVRIDIEQEQSLEEWFRAIQGHILELQQYEYSPLVQVQGWSSIPRGKPLFESLLVYNSSDLYGAGQSNKGSKGKFRQSKADSKNELQDMTRKTPGNDPLILTVVGGEKIHLDLTVDTRLFNEVAATRLMNHLKLLLGKLATPAANHVSDLFTLPEPEFSKVVNEWNDTQVDLPKDACVHHLVAQQAASAPDRIAVSSQGSTLSYKELNNRANALAARLKLAGVGRGDIVGIYLNRNIHLPVALLGLYKAGAAFVPLDPAFPADRLAYMLEDSQADVLLTQRELEEFVPSHQGTVLFIDDEQDGIDSYESVDSRSDDLAYILYTSGTTGRPKGVMVEHHSLVNFLLTMRDRPGIKDSDVLLAVTTLSFDIAQLEIFLPLISGACVEIVSREVAADADLLAGAIEKSSATMMQATPTTWRMLLEGEWRGNSELKVLCGGEALPSDLARNLLPLVGELWNMYGPTETTVWSTIKQITDAEAITIGRPIANTRTYVLNEQLQPVPVGVVGELYIAGEGVVRGYHRMEELTKERFIKEPFGHRRRSRMYRTGDLARWLPSGELECLGRTDHQVKIRSFRIEMGEVETVLQEYPAISQAAVDARPDPAGELRLVAYIVAQGEAELSVQEIRAFMQQSLPDYMIPSVFVTLDALPLTANLKIDRKALPDPDGNALQSGQEYIEARNEREQAIAEEWAEILKVERVGIYDNFFELGGHSLLATRVISRLRSRLDVNVPIPALFENPTVAGLAAWIENMAESDDDEFPLVAIPRNDDGSVVAPQSYAQQRLWFLSEVAAGTVLYTLDGVIPLMDGLDEAALQKTLNEMSRRHESLRTTFATRDGKPVQIVAPPGEVALEVVDLSVLPANERQRAMQQLKQAERKKGFDLARGPLARFKLVKMDRQRNLLLYAMHHIITDGWSMGVFGRELRMLYEFFKRGDESPLPQPALQYVDYSAWQSQWLTDEAITKQLSFWKETLAGLSHLDLPLDKVRPVRPKYGCEKVPVHIPEEIVEPLQALAREEGATMFMLMLGAFQFVLGQNAGQEDVVVGTPIANRTRSELEDMIGFFVNSLVLRGDISGRPTFRELLRRTREYSLQAYNHQDLPFERLVEELAPQRNSSEQPLYQVLFVLQNTPTTEKAKNQNRKNRGTPQQPDAMEEMFYDMTLSLTEMGGQLNGGLSFNPELFYYETVERFYRHFINLLKFVVANPDQPLTSAALIADNEWDLLLARSLPHDGIDAEHCIHTSFERVADRSPEQTALVFQDQQMTYAELDRRTNQLANYLISAGVTVEATVGLCIERCPEWIIGMLGIMKAGAVYVPLNPELPEDRLSWMLEDAAPAYILTREEFRNQLPDDAHVLCFEQLQAELDKQSAVRPRVAIDVSPHNLAYIIYTSGSTGRPKGVMIEHHSICHTIQAQIPLFGLTSEDRVLSTIAPSFDASMGEIFRTLLAGATLYLAPREQLLPGPDLVRLLQENRITATAMVPTVLGALPADATFPDLKTLTLGGEALSAELARRWGEGRRLLNGYGPTEATVGATLAMDWPLGSLPPLGYPLPGVEAYVLSTDMELVPDGIPGELYLGGPGLARGYLNQQELTASSFVSHPFSDDPQARLYRTGDRVSWREDGQLNFLGRMDEQVKIRGHRIEPGEISALLQQHPGIDEAVVIARKDRRGEERLVAYVVTSTPEEALVAEWSRDSDLASDKMLSEQAAHDEDPRLNFSGWVSSYTGDDIPQEEMSAWADAMSVRIESLKPANVVEIGIGSGLNLMRVAPYCRHYVGIDISEALMKRVENNLAAVETNHCQIELMHRRIDDFTGLTEGDYDTLVINSVPRYYPNIQRFLQTLELAMPLVREGGSIFLGDLRNYQLFDAFHASVEFAKAEAALSVERLRQRMIRAKGLESEILFDPRLFARIQQDWPRVTSVQVLPKSGSAHHELNSFRYDVILHLDGVAVDTECQWQEWSEDSIEHLLRNVKQQVDAQGKPVGVRAIPNARTAGHAALVAFLAQEDDGNYEQLSVAELRQQLSDNAIGVDPEALAAAAVALGLRCEFSWLSAHADGSFDAVFKAANDTSRASFPLPNTDEMTWESFANNPAKEKQARNLASTLRGFLAAQLPDYMVPTAYVTLDTLPLTTHGKLNRNALPNPEGGGRSGSDIDYVAPNSDLEAKLANIWENLLELDRVGIHDNFFDIGGHSLLATQVIAAVRSQLSIELPVTAIFNAPTVEQLAEFIESDAGQLALQNVPPLVPSGQDPALGRTAPQSFAQQRLWFISMMNPDSELYSTMATVQLHGDLDLRSIEDALNELRRRHQTLRTTFTTRDGEPIQVVAPLKKVEYRFEDLREVPHARRQQQVQKIRREETAKPFDLSKGPVVRYVVVVISDNHQILLAPMHHIITDGWSVEVFRREFTMLYNAFRIGQSSPLPEPVLQYADFSEWQRSWLTDEELDRQMSYWKQRLDGIEHLELPTDHPRPMNPTYREGMVNIELADSTTAKLKALCQSERATPYMLLLSAFQFVLAKYAGQDDVVVGTPIANRTRTELESIIGFFVNSLVMRADLSGKPSFRELLRQVRASSLDAYNHQDLPFERLVAELAPNRELNIQPIFQIMFSLENTPGGRGQRNQTIEKSSASQGNASGRLFFDITLNLNETGDSILGGLHYNTDLFNPETMETMAWHIVQLLDYVADNPDKELSSQSMISASEHDYLMSRSLSHSDIDSNHCIHELFAAVVERNPEQTALVFQQQQLSYAELDKRANQLAHYLVSSGVTVEATVGLCIERGLEWIIGMLGIMKAGAVYVPLNPELPEERLSWMLEDAAPAYILTREEFRDQLPDDAHVLCFEQLQAELDKQPASTPATDVAPGNLAYIIYTSGSTGRPKGVMIEHHSLCHTIQAQLPIFGMTHEDRVLSTIAPSFDASLGEIFRALLAGATLYLAPREQLLPGSDLVRLLQENHITVTGLVPTVLGALPADATFPDLKTLLVGGEAISAELARRWGEARHLINGYGPTETTIGVTLARDWPTDNAPPLGYPLPGIEAYVIGRDMELLPYGVPGELYLGGPGLARGYLNQPDLTAESFVADPFSDEPGARLYRTGDRVRWLEDGQLTFLGRVDGQVKIRGYRIEPGEINAILGQHEIVSESVVAARKNNIGELCLVAYVVTKADEAKAEADKEQIISELRDHLAARLPTYMLPVAYIMMDALPMTAHGKLDYRALPEPDSDDFASVSAEYVEPSTYTQGVLAGIWQNLLPVERVGINDNFFELGGHSLLATQVIAAVRSQLGVDIPVSTMFSAPTIAKMERWIEQNGQQNDTRNIPPLVALDVDPAEAREALQSFAQQRLWFTSLLNTGGSLYSTLGTVMLSGHFDAQALEAALTEMSRRHQSLRTTFATKEGEPYQFIAPLRPVLFQLEDLRDLPNNQRRQQMQRLRNTATAEPFDLENGPLVRYTLVVLNDDSQVLFVAIHHIITDGWSMGVLRRELLMLYEAYRRGSSSPLPEPGLQYADFTTWQRSWLKDEELERQMAYWRSNLADLSYLDLPTDRPRPAVPRHREGQFRIELPGYLMQKLEQLAQQEEATLFMLLTAAFQFVLGQNAGHNDISIGTPIANRTRSELENIIGFFVNTLVIRTDLSGKPTFRDLLRRVRENSLQAYNHQDVPFERLVDELVPHRELNISPLFQVLLILDNTPSSEGQQRKPQSQSKYPAVTPGESHGQIFYDLTLNMSEAGRGLHGGLHYDADLFNPETAERLCWHLVNLLEFVAESPDAMLSPLALISDEQRSYLLARSLVESETDNDHCIHALFEETASRYPDHPALLFQNQQFTYAELDRRANQLANYLIHAGVTVEATVGVCIERCPEWIVSLLGIMKAGAVYVPLNPELPEERLSWMLEDAAPAYILTREEFRDQLPDDAHVLCFEQLQAELDKQPASTPATGVAPDNLAYIIYTSGSTGRPKGVMIEHHSLCHTIQAQLPLFGVTHGDRVLSTIAPSFDASLGEIFRTLLAGATLYLAPREQLLPGPDLVRLLQENQITITTLVPTVLAALPANEEFPELKTLTLGGEALSAELARRWSEGRRMLNAYGPTETTIGVTLASDWPEGEVPPLGYPLPGVQAYVLSPEMDLLPDGIPGELYLGGPGLARGYLNQPDLTAESFVADPFSDDPEARMYRTGDRVRWREDGQLIFLGRMDSQVKIRGYRIELGEISAILDQCAEVQQSAIVVRKDKAGSQQLVAYVIPDKQARVSDQEESFATRLRKYLGKHLPKYMLPAAYVEIDMLPMTIHGKLDEKALPEPAEDELAITKVEYVEPRNELEKTLAAIWKELLNVSKIGIDDNFFDLGGDSILSVRVIARAAEAGITLTTVQMYQNQTIRELSAIPGIEGDTASTAEQGLVVGDVPLTPIQHWFFEDDFNPEPHHFNWATYLPVTDRIDEAHLADVMNMLLAHHDALRSRFVKNKKGEYKQFIVEPDDEPPVQVVDLTTLPSSEQQAEMERQADSLQTSFDLEHGPLIRLVLFRRKPQADLLLLIVNHLVNDAISWQLLREDISRLIQQSSRGVALRLPPKTASFKEWSETLQAYAKNMPEEEKAYWMHPRRWQGDFVHIPPDHPDGDTTRAAFAKLELTLGEEETSRLQMLSRTTRMGLDQILIAALAMAMGRITGCWRCFVNVERHGREMEQINVSRSVGWFPNIAATLLELPADESLSNMLEVAKEQLDAVPNRGIGYGILKYLGDDETRQRFADEPKVELFFNYFGQMGGGQGGAKGGGGAMGRRRATPPSTGTTVSNKAVLREIIQVNSVMMGGQLKVVWGYSGLHDQVTMEEYSEIYLTTLRELAG